MSLPSRVLPFVFVSLLTACSGGAFEVAQSGEDASDEATADTTPTEDSGTPDDGAAEDGAPDDGAPEDSAPADSSADSSSVDSSPTDASAPETCVFNACGGCTPLVGKPGDACSKGCGGGKLACKGTEELECVGATPLNACGGCGVLSIVPGTACGECGSGKYICDPSEPSKNVVICSDPVTTPGVGTNCGGKCGFASYQCASDKLSTVCVDPVTTPAPGTSCGGRCGTAKYVCTGDLASTRCEDPVTTAAPGTACGGLCGGATFQCASDGKSTACVDPVTTNLPGTACGGKCGSAVYQCKTDGKSTTCVDPVPATAPAIGSKCGVCGTSTYACNSAKTDVSCSLPDDRSLVSGLRQTYGATRASQAADRITVEAMPMTITGNSVRLSMVTLSMDRFDYTCRYDDLGSECYVPDPSCTCDCWNPCTKKSSGADTLTMEIVEGTPSAPGAVLDSASVTPSDVPARSTSTPTKGTTFNFTKDVRLASGTKIFLRLVVGGGSYSYGLYGKAATTTSTTRLSFRQPGTAWLDTGLEPYIDVWQYVCP